LEKKSVSKNEENARKQETFERTKEILKFHRQNKKTIQNSTSHKIQHSKEPNYKNRRFGMPANGGIDPVKLLFEIATKSAQQQSHDEQTGEKKKTQLKANVRMC
jgi:hypothetical protein